METTTREKLKSAELALYNQATDIAGLCKDIVVKTAVDIQGRKFVPVEAWTTIAVAHGCICTIKSVEQTKEGVKAVAELRRQADAMVLSSAEGYVGADEPVWYGGEVTRYNKFKRIEETVVMKKRPDYAIRAMAQTRAMSRVCRTAFSHVVVMMNANLSTVPAEEMSNDDDIPIGDTEHSTIKKERNITPAADAPAEEKKLAPEVPRDDSIKLRAQFEGGKWEKVVLRWSKHKGKTLGELEPASLKWFVDDWQPRAVGGRPISQDDLLLRAALDVAATEGDGR